MPHTSDRSHGKLHAISQTRCVNAAVIRMTALDKRHQIQTVWLPLSDPVQIIRSAEINRICPLRLSFFPEHALPSWIINHVCHTKIIQPSDHRHSDASGCYVVVFICVCIFLLCHIIFRINCYWAAKNIIVSLRHWHRKQKFSGLRLKGDPAVCCNLPAIRNDRKRKFHLSCLHIFSILSGSIALFIKMRSGCSNRHGKCAP